MKSLLSFLLLLMTLSGCSQTNANTPGKSENAYYCPPCGGECDHDEYPGPGKCKHCGMALTKENKEERKKTLEQKRLKVIFYLQNGVEVLDFAGPLEVFSYAGFDIAIVSKTKDPIVSQGVLKITPDYSIADAPKGDIIAFFGGNSGIAANDPEVIAWLKTAQKPEYYFSVCTGAFVLGRSGLLDGLTVTTFHESIERLKTEVPKAKVLANTRFVDNGKVITTAGISAGIDGALHLVERIRGKDAAVSIAKYMEYDKWIPEQGLIMK